MGIYIHALSKVSLDELVEDAEAGGGLVDLVEVPLELTAPGVLVQGVHPHQVGHQVPVMARPDLAGRALLHRVLRLELRLAALVADDRLSIGSRNQSGDQGICFSDREGISEFSE